MKMRAFLLSLLLIGGAYAMIQSAKEFSVKAFHEVLSVPAGHVEQLIFTKPVNGDAAPPAWTVTDKQQISMLVDFLSDYEVRKLEPQKQLSELDFNQFTISLEDEEQNLLTVMAEDSLIVTSAGEQYTVLDGPLDSEWLIGFILSSHSSE